MIHGRSQVAVNAVAFPVVVERLDKSASSLGSPLLVLSGVFRTNYRPNFGRPCPRPSRLRLGMRKTIGVIQPNQDEQPRGGKKERSEKF